jgi:GntR family transcriptional regulator
VYDQLADAIREEILAGQYEPIEGDIAADELPGAAELGARYGVSDKTAARAIQRLIAEGLVRARPGLRPVVSRSPSGPRHGPCTAALRAQGKPGVWFSESDFQGQEVVKEIPATGWVQVPDPVAPLLRLDPEASVWARSRRTLVDGKVVETSVSYFPAAIAEGTDLMTFGPFPPGASSAFSRTPATRSSAPATRSVHASQHQTSWSCLVPTPALDHCREGL